MSHRSQKFFSGFEKAIICGSELFIDIKHFIISKYKLYGNFEMIANGMSLQNSPPELLRTTYEKKNIHITIDDILKLSHLYTIISLDSIISDDLDNFLHNFVYSTLMELIQVEMYDKRIVYSFMGEENYTL